MLWLSEAMVNRQRYGALGTAINEYKTADGGMTSVGTAVLFTARVRDSR